MIAVEPQKTGRFSLPGPTIAARFISRLSKIFKKLSLSVYSVTLAIILNGLLWLLSIKLFPRENPIAILHYNTDIGIDFIGGGGDITILPAIGSLLVLSNIVLGLAVRPTDKQLARILWWILPIYQIVLLIAFYFIWRINN
ncbi:MAG: hypothetical protein U1C49_01260 [Candidatus Andersenbacteria bacterium]|nr:hypothetical protein [bacterium]MDZ4225454.1 hypothetical protein [Candidatus Andersenbacteria bacterium]